MDRALPSSRRWLVLVGWIVVAGLCLRVYHYARNPVVWHDEAALIVNVLDKSFLEQLGPLSHNTPVPPLVVWGEKCCVLLLGESTYALRLLPFLANCLSLCVLTWLALRLLPPAGAVVAVLLAAFSDRLLWHGCEAKAYSFDVLVATVLPALFLATAGWSLPRRLLLFTLVAPLALFLSYPGAFVCGSLLVALRFEVWRERSGRNLAAYGLLAGVVFVSFLLLLLGPIRAQRTSGMEGCWVHCFPNWSRPWTLPWWSLQATVVIVDYCFRPVGGVFAPLAALGGWLWFRQGKQQMLLLLAGPLLLGWLAGLLHAYPYTGARVMVYVLPGLALLIGAAVPAAWAWAGQRLPRLTPVVGVALLLAPLGLTLYRIAQPWERPDWHHATAYVLRHFRPTDRVTGNAWELDYYFRELGPAYRRLDAGLPAGGERLWVVLMGPTEEVRQQTLRWLLDPRDRVLEHQTYAEAGVYCLGRPDSLAQGP